MYTDSEKDLHIYLAPEHEDDLLEELNGIPRPRIFLHLKEFSESFPTVPRFWRRL